MKLIIAGGRNYELNIKDIAFLDSIKGVTQVISGGAPGADNCGEMWANKNSIDIKVFKANWKKHGKAAGPIRNKEMAKYADAVALFPGGSGTESMYNEAIKGSLTIFTNRPIAWFK